MTSYNLDYESRGWFVTTHEGSLKKAGLDENKIKNPEYVCRFLKEAWENSSPVPDNRKAFVSVCLSASGTYHAHCFLTGNQTTLRSVKNIMFDSHVEPQGAIQATVMKYVKKEPPYDNRGENVLCTIGEEQFISQQGKRSDMQSIGDMIEQGYTPREIMEKNFKSRRFEKQITNAYADKRKWEIPAIKQMHVEWHINQFGITHGFDLENLYLKYDPDEIFCVSYIDKGGFDGYEEQGLPSILYIDDLSVNDRPDMLITAIDKYSHKAINKRYGNIYPLWDRVYISSSMSPEEWYKESCSYHHIRPKSVFAEVISKITKIYYHYIDGNGNLQVKETEARQYKSVHDFLD